jgi:ribosomal protein L12E/L44/L45/RPP1/RPP2
LGAGKPLHYPTPPAAPQRNRHNHLSTDPLLRALSDRSDLDRLQTHFLSRDVSMKKIAAILFASLFATVAMAQTPAASGDAKPEAHKEMKKEHHKATHHKKAEHHEMKKEEKKAQ